MNSTNRTTMTTAHPTVDPRCVRIEPLPNAAVLANFCSGENQVDRHIDHCCNFHDRYRKRTYCAFVPDVEFAVGFYCVGISAADSEHLDREIYEPRDGRFGHIPFIYLNYLGVRSEFQNQKIGTLLLVSAIERSWPTIRDIGAYGIALHALTDRAAGLYDRYGFREHGSHRHPFMILPALSIRDLFEQS